MRELPTLEYVTESGARRRVVYRRVPGEPWKTERVEWEHEAAAGCWRYVGTESLRELRIDGEPVSAVSIAAHMEGA